MIYILLVLGAIFGSFLNVCIHRLPRGESIVFPPSRCPNCRKNLSPLDLIPILGYFLLRGKCRYCGARISLRYPLVEFLTALFFACAWIQSKGVIFDFTFQVVFASILTVIFFTDLEMQVIPDAVSIPGVLVGLIYNALRGMPFFSALFGMFLGYILLFAISKAGEFWFKKEVMGEGDYYAGALLGAGLGWDWALLSIFLGYLLGGAVLLVLLALRKVKMGQYVPFGPALAAGGIITLFFGGQIANWYLNLIL